jgi:hypothetical protein
MAKAEPHQMNWNGLEIQVSVNWEWPGEDMCHLEVRFREPLPFTNTGYRSHFMAKSELQAFESPEEFVRLWLEEAARSKDWQRIWEMRRQLPLF